MQFVYREDLRLNSDATIAHIKIANNDKIRVQRLGDTDSGRTTGFEVFWQTQMVKRKLKILATNSQKAGRVEALI